MSVVNPKKSPFRTIEFLNIPTHTSFVQKSVLFLTEMTSFLLQQYTVSLRHTRVPPIIFQPIGSLRNNAKAVARYIS